MTQDSWNESPNNKLFTSIEFSLLLQYCAGLLPEIKIKDGPPVHHARFMGQEICFLQMLALAAAGHYPMDAALGAAVRPLGSFTTNIFAPQWFQAPFAVDSAPLLLSFMAKVKQFER